VTPAEQKERDALPTLAQEEHKMLEQFMGSPLSNDAAQMLRKEWVLWGAFEQWTREKGAADVSI
jgi:hypothetical protein